MHAMAKMAQISCQKCPLWSVEILDKMVFFKKMAKNRREASDFGENGLFCINGEFGTNGANHQAPWRMLILAKMEKFARRLAIQIGWQKWPPWRVAILAQMAKFGKNGEFGTNCKKSPEGW